MQQGKRGPGLGGTHGMSVVSKQRKVEPGAPLAFFFLCLFSSGPGLAVGTVPPGFRVGPPSSIYSGHAPSDTSTSVCVTLNPGRLSIERIHHSNANRVFVSSS